jgi:hypothetical protein
MNRAFVGIPEPAASVIFVSTFEGFRLSVEEEDEKMPFVTSDSLAKAGEAQRCLFS